MSAAEGALRALGVPLPAERDGAARSAAAWQPWVAAPAEQQPLPRPASTEPQREQERGLGAAAGDSSGGAAAAGLGGDKEVLRALLRHERTIKRLQRQNKALRASLCEDHPKSSVCGRGGWASSTDWDA